MGKYLAAFTWYFKKGRWAYPGAHLLVLFHCAIPEEEISNMRLELEKYGIQMPAFGKIGGILANELSVDEAARKGKWVSLFSGWSCEIEHYHGDIIYWKN